MAIKPRTTFKKEINKNGGTAERGVVHVDITAPNEELADLMEAKLVEIGYESGEYGDDLGAGGYLFSIFVRSSEMKEFNRDYSNIKKNLTK